MIYFCKIENNPDIVFKTKDYTISTNNESMNFISSKKFWDKMLKTCGYENYKTASILMYYVKDFEFDFTNVKNNLYGIDKNIDDFGKYSNFIYMHDNAIINFKKLIDSCNRYNMDIDFLNTFIEKVTFNISCKYDMIRILVDTVTENISIYKIYTKDACLMCIEKLTDWSLNDDTESFNEIFNVINRAISESFPYKFTSQNLDTLVIGSDYENAFNKYYIKNYDIWNSDNLSIKELRRDLLIEFNKWDNKDIDIFIKNFSEIPIIQL